MTTARFLLFVVVVVNDAMKMIEKYNYEVEMIVRRRREKTTSHDTSSQFEVQRSLVKSIPVVRDDTPNSYHEFKRRDVCPDARSLEL